MGVVIAPETSSRLGFQAVNNIHYACDVMSQELSLIFRETSDSPFFKLLRHSDFIKLQN
jgi:hypothetical protein